MTHDPHLPDGERFLFDQPAPKAAHPDEYDAYNTLDRRYANERSKQRDARLQRNAALTIAAIVLVGAAIAILTSL